METGDLMWNVVTLGVWWIVGSILFLRSLRKYEAALREIGTKFWHLPMMILLVPLFEVAIGVKRLSVWWQERR